MRAEDLDADACAEVAAALGVRVAMLEGLLLPTQAQRVAELAQQFRAAAEGGGLHVLAGPASLGVLGGAPASPPRVVDDRPRVRPLRWPEFFADGGWRA